MTNSLPFAESLACWQLICYGFGADMAYRTPPPATSEGMTWTTRLGHPVRWLVTLMLGALWSFSLIWALSWTHLGIDLAAVVFVGSILLPLLRRLCVSQQFLAEFETLAFAGPACMLWQISLHLPEPQIALPLLDGLTAGRQTAIAIFLALFLFSVRGGSLWVLGILEKAGGVPLQARPAAGGSQTHTSGEMIGYVERSIVLLIVAAGNLQALAFFFVAKGLARSKKLEDDPVWSNYFVLGSLASFFLALICGLLGQQTLALFWR